MVEFIILNYITKEELAKIREDFSKGKHKKIKEAEKEENKIVANNVDINLEEKVTTDTNENRYRIKDRGIEVIICTTNSYVFEYYKKKNKYPKDLICMRCKQRINNVYGIPVRKIKNGDEINYDVYGVYHSLTCAYDTYIKFYKNDVLFRNSEQLFREISLKLKGTHDIPEAKDINLLEDNYGPLTKEEYDDEDVKIKDEQSIIFIPVKRMYKLEKN